MLKNIAIDISPLLNPRSGIGRSVAGLMAELPLLCQKHDIKLTPYYRRMLGPALEPIAGVRPPSRLRLPRATEPAIARLGLVERVTHGDLFHATDFYLPLRRNTPMIATVHDVIYATQPENNVDHLRIAEAMKRHVQQFIRVIACSEFSAGEFCSIYGYPRERVQVIHWGVDTDHFRPKEATLAERKALRSYFLAVSCNAHRKNTPRLVRSFIHYAAAGGVHDLKLAWTLPEYLCEEVRRAGLVDRVLALGKVSEDELLALYQNAACVMFPSLYEGFGFPVLEALACGTPVLTTRRSSLPEVGGDLAIYVDGEDTNEIVGAMFRFDRGETKELSARCAAEGPSWASRFTWRGCAENTLQTYLSALGELRDSQWRPLIFEPQR